MPHALRRCVTGTCALLALVGCSVARADVTFSDTEFPISNWGFETVTSGTGGTSIPAQVAGGNPGNARQITNNVNANGGTVFGVSRYGTTNATRYDPSTQGAISSIDYSIDARWLSGIGGQGHSIMLGIKQNVTVYYAHIEITGSDGLWHTFGTTGLTAADFTNLTAGAPIDFSAAGAPLRVGFIVGNSAPNISYTNVVLYDNFTAVVHNVPTPGGIALVGVGVLVAMRRRRDPAAA